MVKVSVIMPVYKVEKYLEECLNSVISQSLEDIEIICINNGGTTNESLILENYASKDKRIKLIKFNENQGYGKALNSGIDCARGKYISIVECDDYIDKKMFENLYNKALEHDADIVKSAFINFNSKYEKVCMNNLGLPEHKNFKGVEYPVIFSEHPSIWSCIYKTDFLRSKNIRFLELKDTGWVDNPFRAETFLQAERIVFVSEPFYHYRDMYEGSSSSLKEGIRVPYIASKTTHEVLERLGINDFNVLQNLALLEFVYIRRILETLEFENLEYASEAVKCLFNTIGTRLDNNKRFLKYRRQYYNKSLHLVAFRNKIKKVLRRNKV